MVFFSILVGIHFLAISTLVWVGYLHFEGIFYLFIRRVWLIVKESRSRAIKNKIVLVYYLPPTFLTFLLFLLSVALLKTPCVQVSPIPFTILITICFTLFILVSLVYWYFLFSGYVFNMFTTFSVYNIILTVYALYFCQSIMVLLFVLEVFSVYYYYFFLNVHSENRRFNVLQYKNLLLFFLWNSFLTTITYGLSIYYITNAVGTLQFAELFYLYNSNLLLGFFFFIVSFFWKLGIPGFHFLKVEIYRYLDSQSIFFFSIVTVTMNLILMYFVCTQQVMLLFLTQTSIVAIAAVCMLISSVFFFTVDNLYSLLAWSSVVTLFTALVPLMT